jgi:hypothetical protein
MMQEEVEHKSVVLTTNAVKITGRVLARLMQDALRKWEKERNKPKAGKQSVKDLAKEGSLSTVEVTNKNIKEFDPVARKYNISYSLSKDSTANPPRWTIFFKSKDTDAMTSAFKEFTAKKAKLEKDKPSAIDAMHKNKERVKDRNAVRDKTRRKERKGHEL